MYPANNLTIQMADYSKQNKEALFNKQIPTPLTYAQQPLQEIEDDVSLVRFNRVTGNILIYWLIVLCTAAIPFINLLLFWVQPFELARGINKTDYTIDNLGRLEDFTYFYICMGCYGFISLAFIGYSCFFTSLWERFKLYLLVDNILICMLAADVAYAALHVVSFTATYSSDEEGNLQTEFIIFWQDYLIIGLYCLTNFAFIGIFRVLMVSIYWRQWQTIVYKLSIVISSLIYIGIDLVYIFGNYGLSKQVDEFNEQLDPIIDECFNSTDFLYLVPYLQREQASLGDAKSKIDSFIIFYVFTNFALSYEVIAKLTDFDGTSDLKTHYKLQQQE